MKNMIANYITLSRIILSILLLSFQEINLTFMIIYTICGLTDMIDGYIARKLNTSSELGSILDTISDLFFSIVILKIIYTLLKDIYLILFIIIAFLKLAAIFINYLKYKKFVIIHTYLNKLTGLLIFVLIYFLNTPNLNIYINILFLIGLITAIEEIFIAYTSKKLNLDQKSIFKY